jgi:ATP-dependent exoDNAse (exonuclease V) beta subunit
MRFLHAEDPTAAARAIQYQAMLRRVTGQDVVDPFADSTTLPDPVKMIRRWLAENEHPRLRTTVADLVTELARAVGYRPGEDVQLLTLLDEVHAWTTDNGQDIGGFIAHWERTGGQRSIAPPEHGQAVQVMTVHKAKGLQFPVVIIPQISMSSRGNHGERHWIEPGGAIPELAVALVREAKDLNEAELPELKEENELRLLDLLNLTYVAFTRPEQRLYGMLSESAMDAVSRGLLAYMDAHGTEGALELGARHAPWRSRTAMPSEVLNDVSSGDAMGSLVLRFEAPEDWDPEDPDPKRSFGNAVHYVLERVLVPEHLEAAIAEAVDTGMLTSEASATLTAELKTLLDSPSVRPWFDPRSVVRTEATIITAEGNALRPDRVLFDEGLVRVLDIKTGRPDAAHHDQVRAYMERLAQLGHPRVEGALLYVRQGILETVGA